MEASRITVFAGHYGSGKTNLAVNYALWLRRTKETVVLCDLDIVNPYFRSLDSKEALEAAGITLITSDYANSNAELPAMPSATRAIFDDPSLWAVVDLGGDDRGALALGRYRALLKAEPSYEMLLVANRYRPLSGNIRDMLLIKAEIETAAGVAFTGIVNNSNLGEETTVDDVLDTASFIAALSEETGLPVKMTAMKASLAETLSPEEAARYAGALFPVLLSKKKIWQI